MCVYEANAPVPDASTYQGECLTVLHPTLPLAAMPGTVGTPRSLTRSLSRETFPNEVPHGSRALAFGGLDDACVVEELSSQLADFYSRSCSASDLSSLGYASHALGCGTCALLLTQHCSGSGGALDENSTEPDDILSV